MKVIAAAGHLVPDERPDAIAALVTQGTAFLAAGDAQLVKRLCSFPSAEAIVIEH